MSAPPTTAGEPALSPGAEITIKPGCQLLDDPTPFYTVAGDTLLTVCGASVIGWDLTSGSQAWTFSAPAGSSDISLTASDSLVVAHWATVTPVSGLDPGGASATVAALDPVDGREVWRQQYDAPPGDTAPPPVGVLQGPATQGAVLVSAAGSPGGPPRHIEARDLSGEVVWSESCGAGIDCFLNVVLLEAGALAVVAPASLMPYSVDLITGQRFDLAVNEDFALGLQYLSPQWSYAVTLAQQEQVVSPRTGEILFQLPSFRASDTGQGIIAPNADEGIDCYNYDGSIRWSIPGAVINHALGEIDWAVPGNRLIVQNTENELIVVDLATGKPAAQQLVVGLSGSPLGDYYTRWIVRQDGSGADMTLVAVVKN